MDMPLAFEKPPYPLSPYANTLAFPSFSEEATPSRGVQVLHGDGWLAAVVATHERVRTGMLPQQKHFLLPKPASYFHDLLNGIGGVLFGVFADDELVGLMALTWAASFLNAKAKGRLTAPDRSGQLNKKYGKGRVAIIQSMGLISPYMGRGFSRVLLQAAIDKARQNGCEHLFAQVAEQNSLSWLRFMDQGFAIVAAWVDGHRRYLLRWLPPEDKAKLLKHAKPADRVSYGKNFEQLPALMAQLTAHVEQGRVAFLDNRLEQTGAFNVVFGPARRKLWPI